MAIELGGGASVDAGFEGEFAAPSVKAEKCSLSLKLPKIPFPPTIRITLPGFPPPFLPKLSFEFSLSCDPNNPIDITASVAPNAGRPNTAQMTADDKDT